MNLRRITAGGLVALASAIRASAGAQLAAPAHTSRRLTLAQALRQAEQSNTDVLLAASALDSARADRRAAGALPNPVLGGSPNTPYQYVASIPLDITPQRFSRIAVANAGASAVAHDAQDVKRQVTLSVARAFYDALLAEKKLEIARDRRDAIARVLQSDSVRFRAGDVPERNIGRSEIELTRADADVSRASVDVTESRITLQLAMGIAHADSTVGVDGTLAYRRVEPMSDSLLAIAHVYRADLAAAADRIEQSDDQRHLASSLVIPTPQVSIVRQFSAPFGNGNFYSLGLSFEVPVLNQYRADRERAAAGATAARLSARRTQAQVERDVLTAITEFHAARDRAEQYCGPVTKSAAAVDAARYAYAKGASSLLEVLDALRVVQDVQVEYVTALHDYWVSASALDAAVGKDILGMRE